MGRGRLGVGLALCAFVSGCAGGLCRGEAGRLLWKARLSRLWKAYLRFAVALAGLIGSVILTLQYFILLPPFAWISRRAAKREPEGWHMLSSETARDLRGQY